MANDIIQAQYETLAEIAKQFGERGDSIEQMRGVLTQHVDGLRGGGWEGDGAQAFFREMDGLVFPAVTRLSDALYEADRVTMQIVDVVRSAEEEASSQFQQPGDNNVNLNGTPTAQPVPTPSPNGTPTPTTSVGGDGGGGIGSFIANIAGKIVDLADTIDDVAPIPAAILIALGLRGGKSYPGQVLVRVPDIIKRMGINARWLKGLGGVAENLSHIKGANLAQHIAKGARKIPVLGWVIAGGLGVKAVAETWSGNWDEYSGYDPARRIAAMGVDAGIALIPVAAEVAGGVAGTAIGAWAGGLAGGAIGGLLGAPTGPGAVGTGGVGAAAGALIGGAVGGFAGDWLGGQAGDWVVGKINESGGRDRAIDWIDNNIGQPISSGIGDAVDAVRDFELPSIRLPSLRFGFSG